MCGCVEMLGDRGDTRGPKSKYIRPCVTHDYVTHAMRPLFFFFKYIETKNLSTNYIDFFSLHLLNKTYISKIENGQSTSSMQVSVIKSLILWIYHTPNSFLKFRHQEKKQKKKLIFEFEQFCLGRKKVKIMLDIFIKQTSKQFFIDHMRILFSQEKISYLKRLFFTII